MSQPIRHGIAYRIFQILALLALTASVPSPALARARQQSDADASPASVKAALAAMRAVHIDVLSQPQVDAINQRLDRAWKTIEASGPAAIPVVRAALVAETGQPGKPDYFFLLDASHLLATLDSKNQWDAIAPALARIDADDITIRANTEPYFRLCHQLAQTGRPDALPALLPFLRVKQAAVFLPQHDLTLNPSLICVFLFGSYGPAAEDTLVERLESHPEERARILEILRWIGTAKSFGPVSKLYIPQQPYDMLLRAFSVLIAIGGEPGRKFLLETPVAAMDEKFRSYYAHMQGSLVIPGFEFNACQLRKINHEDSAKPLSRAELDKLLARMDAENGIEDRSNGMALLLSAGASDLSKLIHIRSRMLFRLSDEALDDVREANTLITALSSKSTAPTFEALSKLAGSGNAEAQYRLGLRYACGLGVSASRTRAGELLQAAADQGFEPAKTFLAGNALNYFHP
jgi:hypothetical protein